VNGKKLLSGFEEKKRREPGGVWHGRRGSCRASGVLRLSFPGTLIKQNGKLRILPAGSQLAAFYRERGDLHE